VIECELVDAVQTDGPFGAKGLGETATFGVSPAIANAVHDAVGVRLTSLPLSPEAVLGALKVAGATATASQESGAVPMLSGGRRV
jgi:CO/xanthine dehydrogenase Mo-binding subunit